MTQEEMRLNESRERRAHWKRWGPYLSERQWGTVREDYSADGSAWDYLPHDQARSKAYRWGEDGIAGICDRHQKICFALTLWNRRDPILKERLFGLTGAEGNHGEDVKEYYFYLDSTPTHSYMKFLYKYPQAAFPYADLVAESRRRGRREPEYELLDTGVFNGDRYFDVFVEYAKAGVEDILIKITAYNRGPEAAGIDLLPTLWFRNTWAWGADVRRPRLRAADRLPGAAVIRVRHFDMDLRWLICEGSPELLFTENETNFRRLYGLENPTPFVKDGINDCVVGGILGAVNPQPAGTKTAARYRLEVAAGGSAAVRLRLTTSEPQALALGPEFDEIFAARKQEADEFYAWLEPPGCDADARLVQRQAFAGMLWSKQFYHYDVRRWLRGDPEGPEPPRARRHGRNSEWAHLFNEDVISMPDKWEYPWYAAWDLAFHCVPLALVDPDFAKDQLVLFLREWYMHPNGQLPAYEWAFGDVNPPVHAWAAWRVYKIDKRTRGTGDRLFLERVFQKLLLNFTWWVNRKDPDGRNIFQGGFLGLDNIGVFDRSATLPAGDHIEQSDATAWMAMFSLNMLAIALELAQDNAAYEDMASKFFEHFLRIAEAMSSGIGVEGVDLWSETDGFFYDVLHTPDGGRQMKVRSVVGLVPLFSAHVVEPEVLARLPRFARRMQWFLENRPDLARLVTAQPVDDLTNRRLLALVGPDRLTRVLRTMLDEREFLSPFGIRALSRYHIDHPYLLEINGRIHRVDYEPAESSSGFFGGNSNWRGPIWFPMNFLIVEALQRFDHFYRGDLKVEMPTGSGQFMTLWEAACDLSRRLTRIFLRDGDGRRPAHGGAERFTTGPHWRDLVLFYEYFHGDNGAGVGASHQTGWTGLVAKLLQQSGQ